MRAAAWTDFDKKGTCSRVGKRIFQITVGIELRRVCEDVGERFVLKRLALLQRQRIGIDRSAAPPTRGQNAGKANGFSHDKTVAF